MFVPSLVRVTVMGKGTDLVLISVSLLPVLPQNSADVRAFLVCLSEFVCVCL